MLGMLTKAASGVLALLPCSRTESTLRASKGLRPCWTDFFEHSLSLMLVIFPGAFMGHGHEIFNRLMLYFLYNIPIHTLPLPSDTESFL
jgi:hypothetical protein